MEDAASNITSQLTWETWNQKQQKTLILRGKTIIIQELDGVQYEAVRNIVQPQPPMDFKKGPDGRPIIKDGIPQRDYNYEDPVYLQKKEEAEVSRMLKILEYGLVEPNGLEIPGKTVQEKWEFLKKGTAGNVDIIAQEILKLSNLIKGDLDFLGQS